MSFAAAATSDSLVKIRALLFGRDGDLVKKPQARKCPRLLLVGPTQSGNLAAWAHPFWASWRSSLASSSLWCSPEEKPAVQFSFY